jgi:hypothetical protein
MQPSAGVESPEMQQPDAASSQKDKQPQPKKGLFDKLKTIFH